MSVDVYGLLAELRAAVDDDAHWAVLARFAHDNATLAHDGGTRVSGADTLVAARAHSCRAAGRL